MASIDSGCYECSRNCINNQFCGQDGTISLPKQLKIRVIANPTFWGFNDGSGNVLTSGTAIFSNGHYDFFDGYDELHFAYKQCGSLAPIQGPFKDEQRPDVLYRAVYDPDDPSTLEYGGVKNYGADGTRDDIQRGGAEVYLIDRVATATSDLESCDTSDPTKVYKKFPENFGYGTKISTTDTIFKNKTGAWRYISHDACYDNIYTESRLVSECDGSPKQEILRGDNFGSEYDPFQIRASGERGCVQDGAIPGPYRGEASVHRNSGVDDFVRLHLTYNGGPASGINDGMTLGVYGEYLNGAYTTFGVEHSGSVTVCKLVSTLGSGHISETGHYWSALGTLDPNTCCGGVAHNVSNDTKRVNSVKNYHSDLGRVFNNNKNKLQANRFPENRYTYGLGTTAQINPANSLRVNTTIPDMSSTGVVLESGFPVFSQEYPYYGAFFDIDKYDTSIRQDGKYNKTQGNNQTCYSQKASLSIYPDCITQFSNYQDCPAILPDGTNLIRQISRLAVVYRGCNYDENCVYNDSGNPYFAPTGIEDLRKGLAGQEVYMYVNLSDAWGPKKKPNDACGCVDPPAGDRPPEMVEIPSPVTFPSFPKFDLYPEEYGCNDILWQYKFFSECEGSGGMQCPLQSSEHGCDVRQPYTTYGFIRNLCGSESSDKRKVITEGFSSLIQQGGYRNTTTPTGNTPMYWEFNNPYIHESGQTGGLSSSGNYPFWGLSDSEGRLVAPFFRTKPSIAYGLLCPPNEPTQYPYLDFDLCSTRANGWPTENVPFLVEIDHDDSCIDCASIIMPSGNLMLSMQGLPTSYSHAVNNPDGSISEKYGFNHCRYDRSIAIDPVYSCDTGYTAACSGNPLFLQYNQPYVGNTCGCADGSDVELTAIYLRGTNKVVGWTSTGPGNNSFVQIQGCNGGTDTHYLNRFSPSQPSYGFAIYASFKLACEGMHKYALDLKESGDIFFTSGPLETLYGGGGCSNRFPSAASDLQLKASFVLIESGSIGLFEKIPEQYISSAVTIPPPIYDLSTQSVSSIIDMMATAKMFGCVSYLNEYGCSNLNGYGQPTFFPCIDCPTPITGTCDCDGVVCDDCGDIREVDGFPSTVLPTRYRTDCLCDCDYELKKTWLIDQDGNKTLYVDNEPSGCLGATYAVEISGVSGSTGRIYVQGFLGEGPDATTVSSLCSWHSGPNIISSGINYEFSIPRRSTIGEVSCSALDPPTCESTSCTDDSSVGLGTCGDPIPWTGVSENASVVRRSCYPEMMVVNKIECLEEGFRLYVDREYHSHDRTWKEADAVSQESGPPIIQCVDRQKGAYRYGSGVCVSIPFATPSDGVTPAYYSEPVVGPTGDVIRYRGVCSTNPSSGTFVTQDFVYGPSPIASGEDAIWNYFNLFYKQGFPSAKYHNSIQLEDPNYPPTPEEPCNNGTPITEEAIFPTGEYLNPINRYGIDHTNQHHSCIQNYTSCGGDFFCNKLFFPRKSYNINTRVTRFGSLQFCKSDSSYLIADWYSGYQDFETDGAELELYTEIKNTKFINACDEDNISLLMDEVGLDDTSIVVNDYLPLMGIGNNLFRYTIDSKSCVIIEEACTSSWVPTHSATTIAVGIHAPKTYLNDGKTSFGYYLDKITTTSTDNCLFNPFKIMVDVECCNSNIRTTPNGVPTSLSYVVEGIPSWACRGFRKPPSCGCGESNICGGSLALYAERPDPVCLTIKGGVIYDLSIGDVPYIEDAQCLGADPCPPGELTTKPGYTISNYDSIITGYSIIGGTTPSVVPEVLIGSGPLEDLVGCRCSSGSGVVRWGADLNLGASECSGVIVLSGSGDSVEVGAYSCSEYYYIPYPMPTSCCIEKTVCEVLADSWKIPKEGCYLFTPDGHADHGEDLLSCVECRGAGGHFKCEDSVMLINITEAL